MIVDEDADPADAVRRIRAVADTMARGLGPEHPATLEARLLLTLIVADRDPAGELALRDLHRDQAGPRTR